MSKKQELPNGLKELEEKAVPPPVGARFQTQVKSIDEIYEDASNVCLHDSRNLQVIESSLVQYGPGRSIVLDKDDIIRAGNGTVASARNAGFKEVLIIDPAPDQVVAVRRKEWSPIEAVAYSIVDNRATDLSTFDQGPLKEKIDALVNEDIDINSLGWSDEELKLLFPEEKQNGDGNGDGSSGGETKDAEPEVDRAKEFLKKWGVKTGQVWLIPSEKDENIVHRLMCGDSTKKEDVEKLMDGDRAQMCFTSPPYNAGDSEKLSGNTSTKDTKYIGVDSDKKTSANYERFLVSFSRLMIKSCDYVFVNLQMLAGNKLAAIGYLGQLKSYFCDVLVWNKGKVVAPAMAEKVVNSAFEFIFVFSDINNQTRAIGSRNFRGNVYNVHDGESAGSFSHVNEFKDIHAATMPLHLPLWVIGTFTNEGELICEPFCGTGTTIVACENSRRACYAMEIAPEYVAVSLERLEGIGLKPVLAQEEVEASETDM